MNPSSNPDNDVSEISPETEPRKPDLDSHGFSRRTARADADSESLMDAPAEVEAATESLGGDGAEVAQMPEPTVQELQASVQEKNKEVFRNRLVGIKQNVNALHEKLNQLDKTKR